MHYGVAIVPARVRRPRDKAKAASGVLLAERWILARLRNHTCFSLAELNAQIRTLLEELNHRPFKKLPGSRRKGSFYFPWVSSPTRRLSVIFGLLSTARGSGSDGRI